MSSYKCPQCERVLKSKGGLTTHLNNIHLVLSPSQLQQRDKDLSKLTHKETKE